MSSTLIFDRNLTEKLQAQWQASEAAPDSAILVHLKIFDPCGVATWYLTEQNPAQPDEQLKFSKITIGPFEI